MEHVPSHRWFSLDDPADRRTLVWAFLLFPGVPTIAFVRPEFALGLLPFSLYLGFCAGVLTHNHVHRPVFRGARANRFYTSWLSFFYGFPIWSWIPTHNRNHHEHTNGPGDATSTFRRGAPDSLFEALTYPSRAGAWQLPALRDHWARSKKDPARFRQVLVPTVLVPLVHLAALVTFTASNGASGFLAYLCTLGLPALFAPWSMMFVNYVQHVGCDPESPDDHSRNFVGEVENWFVFDAGLHTVHHEHPTAHWSRYRTLHRERSGRIHPVLLQRNVFAFVFDRYVLGRDAHLLKGTLAAARGAGLQLPDEHVSLKRTQASGVVASSAKNASVKTEQSPLQASARS